MCYRDILRQGKAAWKPVKDYCGSPQYFPEIIFVLLLPSAGTEIDDQVPGLQPPAVKRIGKSNRTWGYIFTDGAID